MIQITSSDSFDIVSRALEDMKAEQGEKFSLESVNLAELKRRTGLSRGKLRKMKRDGFKRKQHGLIGTTAESTVLSGYTGFMDDCLRKGVKNSEVIYDRLQEMGYQGGKTQIKFYIAAHKHLLPAKRQIVSPQGNRGRRYSTDPGESYQMDWGFVNVEDDSGTATKVACLFFNTEGLPAERERKRSSQHSQNSQFQSHPLCLQQQSKLLSKV